MKKIFFLISVVFFALQLEAQYIYNEHEEIIPFSLTEKYKDIVRVDTIHSLVLPSFNNDSLFFKYNKEKTYEEVGSTFAYGFTVDSLLKFQDYAKRIEIEEGVLWIMTIESETVQSIGIEINSLELPEYVYFSVYPGTIPGLIQDAEVGFKKDIDNEWTQKHGFDYTIHDKKMVIEIFVPTKVNFIPDPLFNKIIYGYQGLGRPGNRINYEQYKKEIHNKSSGTLLKSGGHTTTPALSCQRDVVCSDVYEWANESKSVVFIQIPYSYNNTSYLSQGSGFFLNKSGSGYIDSDNPIMITCRHLFAHKISSGNYFDLINNYGKIEIYVDYQNASCNELKTRYGKNIIGTFSNIDIIGHGNSYNPSSTSYSASDDFAILRPTKTIQKLANYHIEYSGWNMNYSLQNSNNTGYAYIGHPSGDVKKVNKDNGRAFVNSNGNEFGLYCDIGAPEEGFSGGPVFNSISEIVGWVCTKDSGVINPCNEIGKEIKENRTGCGRLDNLWFDLSSYIDPNFYGSAASSNPQPPTPPAHCSNCILDYDETDIDCGGSDCYPCGMQDVLAIKTDLDLLGIVKSRYEIFAEPDPGTLLALKSGDSRLEAGLNIYLNGGFEVQKGATFYAGIEAELMTEADRGCQPACVNLANVFTPNGDGINDYWGFGQAFVTSYDLLIWDRNNNTIYSVSNQPVYENGGIYAWDGTGTNSGEVYYGTLTYRDCYGNPHAQNFFTHVYKSATILADNSPKEEIIQPKKVEFELKEENSYIKVFPNPFTDQIQIHYNGDIFPLKYKLTDLNGKEIIMKETSTANEQVDLSGVSSGVYIIHAKAGDCNLIQQIIKK